MSRPETLGDVIYAGQWNAVVLESNWVDLVGAIAGGDARALHELAERTYHLVFALIRRGGRGRKLAEEITLAVLWDIWRGASRYDASKRTVLAWVMHLARTRSLDAMRDHLEPAAAGDECDVSEEMLDAFQERLARRMSVERGGSPILPGARFWVEPGWKDVAPGIACKLLATDLEGHRVSMLVRLSPGGEYPAHTHFGTEELHLLEGELWIDEKKLVPGDYNYCPPGTSDTRVWSKTGCLCVLVTSTKDQLR